MKFIHHLSCVILGALALLASSAALADYPDRPVRVIVPFAAGAAADSAMRVVGKRMGELLHLLCSIVAAHADSLL